VALSITTVARFTRLPSPGKTPTTLVRLGPPPQTNRPPLGQGKAAGCPQGKEEARMAPPPRPPDPLFPPPPPRVTSPVAFPNRPAPRRLTPVFPPHLPRTGVRRPAARPARRPSHPPKARQDEPPWPSPPAPPGWPEAAWRGRAGRWGRLAVDACRGTNPVSRGSGKGWGRGVAEPMDGPLVEGALPVGVHGTPSFLTP
jgi:hypothetical protein